MGLLPELPLFRRELTELANRRRTYIVRVVGAVILCAMVWIAFNRVIAQWEMNATGMGASRYFGIGREVFAAVVPLLFRAIQLLLPALCCASITAEKERNTIGTLLLTRLSPWTIIWEKLLSRIVPMITILLLSAPILTYVYSLGGVGTYELMATFWLLFCECLLIASIAIMCSAWFSSTVSAFVCSYSMIAFLAVTSAVIGFGILEPVGIWEMAFSTGRRVGPISTVFTTNSNSFLQSMFQFGFVIIALGLVSIPSLVITLCCLVASRLMLTRRAFVSKSSILLKVFHVVDQFFTRLNERTTGGIELVADSNPMPEDDPVAWRERCKKSLGKARYLFRMVLLLEVPTVFICVIAADMSSRNAFEGLYVLQGLLWALAAMIVAVKGATLFSSERARETIEPLLASPMAARELVDQKIDGARRLIVSLSIPLLTVNLTHMLLRVNLSASLLTNPLPLLRPLLYVVLSVLSVFVVLSTIIWFTTIVGLRIHSQTRAVLVSVVLVGLWASIPPGFASIMADAAGIRGGADGILTFVTIFQASPASVPVFTETFLQEPFLMQLREASGETGYSEASSMKMLLFEPVMVSVVIYLAVLFLIRMLVRRLAPILLNRREGRAITSAVTANESPMIPATEGEMA